MARIRWGDSAAVGWIELWFDGQWQGIGPTGPNGVPRVAYATNPNGDDIYLKGGIYRSSSHPSGTSVHYLDDVRVYDAP